MADTSLVQSFKLSVIGFTGLSKDALHIYAGLMMVPGEESGEKAFSPLSSPGTMLILLSPRP